MVTALKRRSFRVRDEVESIWEVERKPRMSRIESEKHLGLPPLSPGGILLQKLLVLEEEVQCGAHSSEIESMHSG
jgi:hypothetical protein